MKLLRVNEVEATTDDHVVAGHDAGIVRFQEQHGAGDLFLLGVSKELPRAGAPMHRGV
jgi:hypothetical protein